MGFVYADITLKNAVDVENCNSGIVKEPDVHQTTVQAIVDTGAGTLIINEAMRQQLGLKINRPYYAKLADGSDHNYGVTGPVQIHWKDRTAICEAVVVPSADKVLLGAIPLEAMDLIVHPSKEELIGAHGDKMIFRV